VRHQFGDGVRLLPLIFATDGSHVSNRRSVKPIYLSLGVHKLKHRRNIMARECIGYIPDASLTSARYKQVGENALAKRVVNLKCWQRVITDLQMPNASRYYVSKWTSDSLCACHCLLDL
jgi:hypothetical protein